MLDSNKITGYKPEYVNVFLVEDRNAWQQSLHHANINTDLILCLDFGLFNDLRNTGYSVAFLDYLTDTHTLQKCNADMNHFIQNWFKDVTGTDLLVYKGLNIGDALLLNVLNDITYFCHFFFNIISIREISYQQLFIAIEDPEIIKVLDIIGISYTIIEHKEGAESYPVYNFPIARWMGEQINRTTLKHKVRDFISNVLDVVFSVLDVFSDKTKKAVFIQNYHPTRQIISSLYQKNEVKVILADYIKGESLFKQRRIKFRKSGTPTKEGVRIQEDFRKAEKQTWVFQEFVISDYLYEKINPIVAAQINQSIAIAESIISYFSKNKIDLMIPITNLWMNNRLIMNYCRNNKIPVFMVINGLLNVDYWQDGHDSDYVNCYSESIRTDYFNSKKNVLALGDTRMDRYADSVKRSVNRQVPNITIGAAGFDNIDLNSYLAFEFDFLFDILAALRQLKNESLPFQVTLKIRANGYANLYRSFADGLFPDLNVKIIQDAPFYDVITEADLYISFYSQSIMEASSLGIPAIYFKKDTQNIYRPFDEKSELATSCSTADLAEKVRMFYAGDSIFEAFLDKDVIEKYIGPLDGNNITRNIDFIHELLQK